MGHTSLSGFSWSRVVHAFVQLGRGRFLDLRKNCSIESMAILMKKCSYLFDFSWERLNFATIWVWVSGLPLQYWSMDVILAIGNKMGELFDAYMSFLSIRYMSLAQILVKLEPREGLYAELEMSSLDLTHQQTQDYEGIPFRCRRCHQHGH